MKQIIFLAVFGYLTWFGYNKFYDTDSFKYGVYTNKKIGFFAEIPIDWSEVEKNKQQFYKFNNRKGKTSFLAVPPEKDEAIFMITLLSFKSGEQYALDVVTKDVLKKQNNNDKLSIKIDKEIDIKGIPVYRIGGLKQGVFYEYVYFVIDRDIIEIGFKFEKGFIKKYNEAKIRIINSITIR